MKPYIKYAEDVLSGKIVAGELIQLACKRFLDDLKRPDLVFKEDKVDRAIRFIGLFHHFKGEASGLKFNLLPWQTFIIANIVGLYYKDSDTRKYTRSYIEVSRKQGKALSLDTPIPTPTGWTTMGEIKTGDIILGLDGNPTTVTFVTPVQYDHRCYKVTFEDGEEIIADAEHNWFVRNKQNKMIVRTTEQLLKHYKHRRNDLKGTEYLYRVPMNKAIDLPQQDLPIDPYTLGLWLGDGTRKKPNFTVHRDDLYMYDALIPLYGLYKTRLLHGKENTLDVSFAGDIGKNNSVLRNKLKEAGVFNYKHIPKIFLRASIELRLALLLGLMDTDGTVGINGECEFTQKNTDIADGLCEILSSLGIKYTRHEKIPTINGKIYDKVLRIKFFTDKRLPCFRLKRKYDRLKDRLNKRMDYKSIINISPVSSVPVKCITVDNPLHLYLCGKHFTCTHNTATIAALSVYFMVADGEDGAEVDLAANSKDQAKIAFEFCSTFANQIDKKGKYFHCLRDNIYYKPNKSKMIVFAADDTKLDGFNASFAIYDEFHAAKNSKVYDVIKSSMGMRKNPHLCVITTAGFNMSSPCYRLRNTCIEVLKGLKEEDSLFPLIYEMDINDDWTDSNNWIKCAPNLGVTVKKKYLRDLMQSAINNPSEETGVKTKNFNIWCSSNNNWLQDRFIINSTQKIDFNDFKDQYCYIGVDLSATSDLTAVCYLMPTEQGKYYFKLKYYLPESCIKDSPNREQYRLWANTGQLTLTPGNVTDYDYITKDIINVSKELNIVCIGYDKWNATQWAITCTEQGLPLYEYGQNMGNFNQPTKEFERLILSGKVILDNNEITRWCFQNALIKEDFNENIRPIKTFKDKKIDGVIAIILSLGVYFQKPINW